MKRLALFSIILLAPSLGHANLGDTLAKCEERYGPPVPGQDRPDSSGVGDVILTFQKNGCVMHMILVRGYVGGESFEKADRSPLTEKEKSALMEAEAHGWAWAKNTAAAGENWLRTDGAVATYVPSRRFLVLETSAYLRAVAASQAPHR
jgi:hypothetical protein